jgi:hypothetical protein
VDPLQGRSIEADPAMHHDEYVFIESIRKKFWLGMLASIDTVLIATAKAGPRRGGSEAEFMRFLMAAREYLLAEGRARPPQLDEEHFQLLKPLCENLVAQGRFPHETLQLFGSTDHWGGGSPPRDDSETHPGRPGAAPYK